MRKGIFSAQLVGLKKVVYYEKRRRRHGCIIVMMVIRGSVKVAI